MDIAKFKNEIKTNQLINGETVSYTAASFVSLILLFAFKQLLKLFTPANTAMCVFIAFISAEIISYILEKRFVFRKKVLSSSVKQICFFIFRACVDFGFYKLSQFIFGDMLDMSIYFVWSVAISICFFFNYFFDRLILFDCAYKAEEIKYSRSYIAFYNNRYVVLSGVITAICICAVYIGYTAFPFGDYTVMRMDLYHQYGPLFAELYDRVINHQSLLYSWVSGGGSSFLGNYFNYLSSPLTAIIFLFDKADISVAISAIVTVKCILSSLTFSYYIRKSLNSSNYFSSSFGVLYAFSAYFLAYYWNVMWLDAMFLLPIIALGIERLINSGKASLYIAALVLALLSNYYMGFMCCIFSVIYFLAYIIITSKRTNKKSLKNVSVKERYSFKNLMKARFFNRSVKFALSSLAVGGLCAFMLVPVFFILKSSSATSGTFPSTFESSFDIFDFITSHLPALETTIRSSGEDVLPNVYSGTIVLLLIPLFILNKNIRFKEKFVYIVLMLFMLFSFDNNIMNYLWHAMHFPNDLPFRFSYMYSFIILVAAYKCLINIKAISTKDICLVGMSWIFFICIAQKMATEKMSEATIYASIAFVIIWCGFLYLFRVNKLEKAFMYFLSVVLIFTEIVVCDISAFEIGQTNEGYKENYNDYTEAINTINRNDDGFYRVEMTSLNLRMDPCYYGYNGISTFSSMAYENYSQLQKCLGMYGNRINSYTYNGQTAVYNMMFNIKYLIDTSDTIEPDEHLFSYSFTTSSEQTNVYENKFSLPIAYCASNNLENWYVNEDDPFKAQSDYFELATGYSDVFVNVDYLNTDFDEMSGDKITSNGNYWFYKSSEDDYGKVTFTITPKQSGNLYLYISSSDIETVDIDSDKFSTITQEIDEPYILDLGYFEEGEAAYITLDCQDIETTETYADIYAYTLNNEVFEHGYNKLNEGAAKIESHSDTSIYATVNAYEDCYLYTSIPYDDGWTVKIDGQECETFSIGNDDCASMLCTALKKGEHTVEFNYKPKGLNYGIAVTAATFAAVCGYIAYTTIIRKKRIEDIVANNKSSV